MKWMKFQKWTESKTVIRMKEDMYKYRNGSKEDTNELLSESKEKSNKQ
jgi:hypothetical protein